MIRRRAACAALAAALAGCATPRAPTAADELTGRLSVRVDSQPPRSVNSAFELRGSAERGELVLTSPLGTMLAQARWAPGSVELRTSDGTRRFADLDSLAAEALGEALPLAALFDWLRGRPWAGATSTKSAAGFDQLGWSVNLERFTEGWVIASRAKAPAVTVRARLEGGLVKALYDVPAPAKLNLFLHVIGRRADGYHLLQSPFVLIDWCDTLHFERRDDGALARRDLGATLPADDLTLRAARALQAESSTPLGADISIDKQVPWGAGMGGGSSDAASTLLALNRLWGLDWPRERLLALAARLGADVPFFVGGHNAFVEGIGERLTPIELPSQWFAVVKPPVSIETQVIFASPLLARNTDAVILSGFLSDTDFGQDFGHNDLQPAAEAHSAEVAQAAGWLRQRFGNSRMTGSGSAVFARAGTGDQPLAAWSPEKLPAGWVGRMCRSLTEHPLVAWAG